MKQAKEGEKEEIVNNKYLLRNGDLQMVFDGKHAPTNKISLPLDEWIDDGINW